MDFPKIHESEYRFCLIMWEHEPVTAVELVKLCQDQLGWKRTTTYTVIKRLGERGVLKNDNGTVTSDPVRPVMWTVAIFLICHFVIIHGVRGGIEKASKVMPSFFSTPNSTGSPCVSHPALR